MVKFEVGDKVLDTRRGGVGRITAIISPWTTVAWGGKGNWSYELPQDLIPVPSNTTETQIQALKDLYGQNRK